MADNPTVPAFVRFWNQSGQRSIVALNCSAAIDPQATWVPVICEQSGHPDKFHRFRTVASYGIVRSLKGIHVHPQDTVGGTGVKPFGTSVLSRGAQGHVQRQEMLFGRVVFGRKGCLTPIVK